MTKMNIDDREFAYLKTIALFGAGVYYSTFIKFELTSAVKDWSPDLYVENVILQHNFFFFRSNGHFVSQTNRHAEEQSRLRTEIVLLRDLSQ